MEHGPQIVLEKEFNTKEENGLKNMKLFLKINSNFPLLFSPLIRLEETPDTYKEPLMATVNHVKSWNFWTKRVKSWIWL